MTQVSAGTPVPAEGTDIISLGMLADDARRERHGTRTTFVRVADVAAEPGAPAEWPAAAGEIRITGVPTSAAAAVARVRELAPRTGGIALSGFSLADLEHAALAEQRTLRSLLEELQAAGLELVAEAPFDALQNPRRAIEEVNIAGMTLARLTILQATGEDVRPQFENIAALQRTVAVVRAFAPLPRRTNVAAPSTGYDDVKRVALARLLVPNVLSIQVDWSLYGPKLAQVALAFGADDVDAVSAVDDTSEGRRRMALEEVQRNIRAAGFEPVERGGRFER